MILSLKNDQDFVLVPGYEFGKTKVTQIKKLNFQKSLCFGNFVKASTIHRL